MTEKDMLSGLFMHPVKDADADGKVSTGEYLLYILKMIPYSILSILIPTLKWAITDGVKAMMPIAVEFVRDIALSQLPGNEKASIVRERLKVAAQEKGIELATRDINRLIENALAFVDEESR